LLRDLEIVIVILIHKVFVLWAVASFDQHRPSRLATVSHRLALCLPDTQLPMHCE
jgi:hypothetical protein